MHREHRDDVLMEISAWHDVDRRALWTAVLLCGLSGSRSVDADTRDTVATSARYRRRLASATAIHFEPVCGGDVEQRDSEPALRTRSTGHRRVRRDANAVRGQRPCW